MASENPLRKGRSAAEILQKKKLPHWLEQLGYALFKRESTTSIEQCAENDLSAIREDLASLGAQSDSDESKSLSEFVKLADCSFQETFSEKLTEKAA